MEYGSRENNDWIKSGGDYRGAGAQRRGQVYGRIRLIESGFGQVDAGYSRNAHHRAQQKENQNPVKMLHFLNPRFAKNTPGSMACQWSLRPQEWVSLTGLARGSSSLCR